MKLWIQDAIARRCPYDCWGHRVALNFTAHYWERRAFCHEVQNVALSYYEALSAHGVQY
jgi:hypothetical protein